MAYCDWFKVARVLQPASLGQVTSGHLRPSQITLGLILDVIVRVYKEINLNSFVDDISTAMASNDRAGFVQQFMIFITMASVPIAEFSPTTSITTTQAQEKTQNVGEALDPRER